MAHDDQTFPETSGVSAFGSLALQVVSVLSARQSGQHANQARPYIRSILEKRLTTRAHFNATDALEELRAFRLSDDAILTSYIPEAARSIGEKWVTNELGFADVTIASVRLQSLLAEIEYLSSEGQMLCDPQFDVLMVTCDEEQHTLGSFVAAAQLRKLGATIERLCGEPDEVIRKRIAETTYDAVMFSSSRGQDLEKIANIVSYAKQTMSAPPLFALGGIVLETYGNLKRLTGVDLVTSDVDMVVSYCGQRSTHTLIQAHR